MEKSGGRRLSQAGAAAVRSDDFSSLSPLTNEEQETEAKIDADDFYGEYHGHAVSHLQQLVESSVLGLSRKPQARGKEGESAREVVWLAGDSSLDSKYWFDDVLPACNGFEGVLEPPVMKGDLCYWLNRAAEEQHSGHLSNPGSEENFVCVNAAVEESMIADRLGGRLRPQDELIRDYLRPQDTLVLSVGGNDVVLRPKVATVWNMLKMTYLNNTRMIEDGPRSAFGMGHFIRLFKDNVEEVIRALTCVTKPRRVIVCMIYYPDMTPTGGWADFPLKMLKYRSKPELLQTAIRVMFERATSEIRIEGTEVVPFPMFMHLDGTDSSLYVAGVEPSSKGNEVLAAHLFPLITGDGSRIGGKSSGSDDDNDDGLRHGDHEAPLRE
jgi:hypothetical protein